jgi:Flavin-binding monooxygenase-like
MTTNVDQEPAGTKVSATSIDLAIRLGFIGLLGYWSFRVMAPFLTIALWSAILAVALHPLFDWLAGRLNRRNDNGLSSAYKTLHINTAKSLTSLSDFPFSGDVQSFPSHWDMHRYFERFVKHFGLRPLIRFRSRVTSVMPLQGIKGARGQWVVETDAANGGVFDAVVVASGHLSSPLHSEFLRSFRGQRYVDDTRRGPERQPDPNPSASRA